MGGSFTNNNVNNTSIFNPEFNNYAAYKGYSPEMLVFDKILTPKESVIFQSYLALKYGLSLDTTYLAPDGKIMWDYINKSSFNNRITGYTRQDALGLYQTTSTTSYEETPYYSYMTGNDSFDEKDYYNMSSRSKLLVVGNQPANPFNDGDYVIFGDNNESLSLSSATNIPSYRTIARKWLVRTNVKSNAASMASLAWDNSNLNIVNIGNYKSTITKPASQTLASATTSTPLKGKDGYFGWTVGSLAGAITVKFGGKNANLNTNTNDYGYILKNNGNIYKIERGVESASPFTTISVNQKLEIEKTGNIVYLRKNGLRIKDSECLITNTADQTAKYYGAISIEGDTEITLNNFRHGGFVNTGNRVELSFFPNRAVDFAADKNNVYLIVDRTGTGNFNAEIKEYLVDEIDLRRSKLIFNNVFWDTDENGEDIFTFGYNTGVKYAVRQKPKQDISEEKDLQKDNSTSVYYKDMKDLSLITVKVYLYGGEPYTLLVNDISGKSIYKKDFLGSKEEQFTDIRLPYPGFYVVKVISKSYQYSTKVITNK